MKRYHAIDSQNQINPVTIIFQLIQMWSKTHKQSFQSETHITKIPKWRQIKKQTKREAMLFSTLLKSESALQLNSNSNNYYKYICINPNNIFRRSNFVSQNLLLEEIEWLFPCKLAGNHRPQKGSPHRFLWSCILALFSGLWTRRRSVKP